MAKPPNVVLIMTDQLRDDVVGGGTVRTPRLDRFAAEGLRLTRAFTPCGICSPARNSILTGRYPHGHGVVNNVTGPDAVADDVRPDLPLLPRLLADAGYRTGHVGKYHVAAHEAPKRHGFTDAHAPWMFWEDTEYHAWRAAKGYPVDPADPASIAPVSAWTTPQPLTPAGAARRQQRGFPIMGKEEVPPEATHPAYLVDRAVGLLDEYLAGDDPFFLTLSFLGPHWPHLLPEPYWSMYDPAAIEPWPNFAETFEGKPGAQRKSMAHHGVEGWTWDDWRPVVATYFGSVTFHDLLIGRFLDALADRGLDDTLVVATADHGDMTGSHRQFNKGPYGYEELYRIPMMARWPGRIAPGSRSEAFTSLLDLMPTFLAAAGVAVPEGLHGRDLAPVLAGDVPEDWPDSFVAEYSGNEFGLYSQRILRTERYKFVYNPHDLDELYDLETDPHELVNLAEDPAFATLRRELEAKVWAWMDATGDPLA